MNQSINRLDFIEWAGKVTGLHAPPAGWNLYEFKLDRDSNTLVRSDNLGRSNLFASPANATALDRSHVEVSLYPAKRTHP
jgi:hypothetical protein